LDDSKLDALVARLGGSGVVIRHGYLVKSWGDYTAPTFWNSSSKPLLSTMLFFAIQEGRVSSVNERISDWGWDLLPKDQTMEFSHLANMTSGYARAEDPGAAWAYNDTAIQLYAVTLFDQVFESDRFHTSEVVGAPSRLGPLRFEDGDGAIMNKYGAALSPRDWARLSLFWLNKGMWNGDQLLDKSYFDNVVRPQVPIALPRTSMDGSDYLGVGTYGGGTDQNFYGQGVYGYNWWFNGRSAINGGNPAWPDGPDDAMVTYGAAGRSSVIFPSEELIVVGAGSNWGTLNFYEPDADDNMNRSIKLISEAIVPSVGPTLGDMNHNGVVDFDDIMDFVFALNDPVAYKSRYGVAPLMTGDTNQDGRFDFDDVAPFTELLGDKEFESASVPEPPSVFLVVIGVLTCLCRNRSRIGEWLWIRVCH